VSVKSAIARVLPSRLIAPTIQRRMWTQRVVTTDDDHIALYWNSTDFPRRRELIQLLATELAGRPMPLRILEFGSHVGVNLKLLAELPGLGEADYFAVEPNFEAVAFLKSKLPDVRTLRGDHRDFLRARDFPGVPLTLAFANAVLYSMAPRAAHRVVRKMLTTSAIVVIGDKLDNSRGSKSKFREDHNSFMHPYETWMNASGVTDIRRVDVELADYALSGFLVAVARVEPTD
jgi:SAM-dependent methyltransferase